MRHVVRPCRETGERDASGRAAVEVTAPATAQFWTVYAIGADGHEMAVSDHASEAEARAEAERLQS